MHLAVASFRVTRPDQSSTSSGPAKSGDATATGDVCVYVLGMHRSGTSATTGLLCGLGLGAPREEIRLRPADANAKGFFEAQSLNRFDERLLDSMGGCWYAPPDLAPGWEDEPTLGSWKHEATRLFQEAFGPRPLAWKDPRAALLIAFWRKVIRSPVAAVLVHRDPFEVASSLHRRNNMRLTHALALWYRYTRSATLGTSGMPTYVLSYPTLLGSPREVCKELIGFLTKTGIHIERGMEDRALGFLEDELRHARSPHVDTTGCPESVTLLSRKVESLEGAHDTWAAPDLGPEPAWVADTLAMVRELRRERAQNDALTDARPMRMARTVYRLNPIRKR